MLAWLIAQRPIPNEKVMPRVVSMLWQPTRPVTMLALQVALRLIPKEKKNWLSHAKTCEHRHTHTHVPTYMWNTRRNNLECLCLKQ